MTVHYLKPEFENTEIFPRKPIPQVDPPEGFVGTWTPQAPYFILIESEKTVSKDPDDGN
jgi:hypothetical protein